MKGHMKVAYLMPSSRPSSFVKFAIIDDKPTLKAPPALFSNLYRIYMGKSYENAGYGKESKNETRVGCFFL